jgi:hypothetical protein
MGTVPETREYRQHRPESTGLYKLVAVHLETFLAEARARYERGLPRYVEHELSEYLKCGIHAHGFLRARCRDCGRDLLVAFSCKRRGVCPSCNARRMCGTAAHLTDRVLPDVPVRQWVLSVPFELRLLLAREPAALSAAGRIFVQEILRWQRIQAHIRASSNQALRGGAISFPQRFGGSLNPNVHYHVVVPDGVVYCARARRTNLALTTASGAPPCCLLAKLARRWRARLVGRAPAGGRQRTSGDFSRTSRTQRETARVSSTPILEYLSGSPAAFS